MSAPHTTPTASGRPQLVAARPPAVQHDPKEISAIGKQTGRQAGNSVKKFFEANREAIAAVLPQHMTPERMSRIAMTAMRTTPKLGDCHLATFFGAVIACSQLGLEPNTPQGHIYLIPFVNNRKGETEVQVIIGYKGLIDLARRSGQIISLSARVVYAKDPFSIDYGTDDRIVHAPYMDGDRGPMVGVYAVAKLKDGGVQFEFMTKAEVDAVRDGSQGYQTAKRFNKTDTPWIKHYEEMARKTAIRRLAKYLPMSIEMAGAVISDERTINADMARDIIDGDFSVLETAGGEEDRPEDSPTATDDAATKAVTHQPEPETDFDPVTGEVKEPARAKPSEPMRTATKAAAKPAAAPPVEAPGSLADDDYGDLPV